MKVALIALIMLMSSAASAQKCRFDYDITDPITGKRKKQIDCTLAKSWKAHFVNNDGEPVLAFYLLLPGSQNMQISTGDTLLMKLEDGSLVTLTASRDALPTPFIGPGAPGYRQVLSYYVPEYRCTTGDLKKLAESPIAAFRIFFGSTPVTLEQFKEKHLERIMAAANCIMQ